VVLSVSPASPVPGLAVQVPLGVHCAGDAPAVFQMVNCLTAIATRFSAIVLEPPLPFLETIDSIANINTIDIIKATTF
jgi:hypothetical protein